MPETGETFPKSCRKKSRLAVSRWKQGTLNPHTGRDFVQFGKTESVLNKGAEKIALLFNPPPVLSLRIIQALAGSLKIFMVSLR